MSELTTIARPYAEAAFKYAQQTNQVSNWSTVLDMFATVYDDKQVASFVSNPTASKNDKISFFMSFVEDLSKEMKDSIQNFVHLLSDYRRLTALPKIAELFTKYREDFERSMQVTVISAQKLDSSHEKSLIEVLSKRLNRNVNLSVNIDDSLIGGAVIHAGDFVIDGSVRGKLDKLAAQLAE